jgi:hypothetical protein
VALMSKPYVLVLYGSRARGDDDYLSDIDMLYVGDERSAIPINEVDKRVCISHYTWDEFEAMQQYGSLFLLHLKMHSRPISFSIDGIEAYSRLLNTLPPYQHACRNIHSFRLALSDVREALESKDTSVELELGYMATTLRHAAILGCYLLGKPEFGRYAAVETFCRTTGLPSKIVTEFVHLYHFRMMIARDERPPQRLMPYRYVENWLDWSTDVVEEVAVCYEKKKY